MSDLPSAAGSVLPARNLLDRAVSPYLLQHAANPVHWREWGPAALAEAAALNRPILLSVGYAACHWCHVMAHESFENPAMADLMNRLFVNIKVDREERPEIDQIYMSALHALGEQGGWPLTMFLKPDGTPFWGGTYFPPAARYGRPGFADVLQAVARAYGEDAEAVRINSASLTAMLQAPARASPAVLDRARLDEATERLLSVTDAENGGVRGAPKFPQAPLLELHWRAFRRTGETRHRDHVLNTLAHIVNGGIHDHIGGGFARYSVDQHWLVPHFEKMLYDNAQLIPLLVWAFCETGEPTFRRAIETTVAWLDREMTTAGGAFAASLDADSEGEEGLFYLWTPAGVAAVLGDDAGRFCSAFDIRPGGNFEGRSIPNRLHTGFADEAEETALAPLRARLLAERESRVRPARDDKVLADWNGLAIAALAEAGMALGRSDWIARAAAAWQAVVAALEVDGRLAHAARAGRRTFPGLSGDHAALILAAVRLAEATGSAAYLEHARRWADVLETRHRLPDGRYALSADDGGALIARLASGQDDATPSGNALVAEALVQLWLATGETMFRDRADDLIAAFSGDILAGVFGHAGLLNALDSRLAAVQVAVVRPAGAPPAALTEAVRTRPRPGRSVAFVAADSLPAGHPAHGKGPAGGRETAYVCREGACSLPVTEPAALAALLA